MTDAQAPVNDENKKPINRRAVRGKTAALLGNLNESDDDSDVDAGSSLIGKPKKAGIYSQKLTQTKLEIKDLHHKFEAKILVEKDLTHKNKLVQDKHDAHDDDDDDDDDDNNAICLLSSQTHEKDNHQIVKRKKSTQDKSESEDDSPPSSPPPPPTFAETKSKRKSASLIDRQLKELEKLKNDTKIKKILNDSKDKSNAQASDEDDIINTIKVKVLTINGVCGWEIDENETFQKIFEEMAKKEKIDVERVILMLNERKINYSDTPASLNLKITDILDFSKAPEVIQEKIRIIENQAQDDEEVAPNKIKIIFQTQEGRKSRLKFLIAKDEKFDNVLEKYCDRMNLDKQMHIIEFDGDQVNLTETPNDLDLDGDEIFDVRKSSKPIMAKVAEKKKVYDFDDDILII